MFKWKGFKLMMDMITIVSGLPRSGTSMMMKMMEAGGIPALVDGIREADTDNPKGYYEFEKVKQTKNDASWLNDAPGKVTKMVSRLLVDLPGNRDYKVVFMRRDMSEILASQKKMLKRKGLSEDDIDDTEMAELFNAHLADIQNWLAAQSNFEVLYIWYNDILKDPTESIEKINRFLGGKMDTVQMSSVVDNSLYRNRK